MKTLKSRDVESLPPFDDLVALPRSRKNRRATSIVVGCVGLSALGTYAAVTIQAPKWSAQTSLYFPSGSVNPNALNVTRSILESESVLNYVESKTQAPATSLTDAMTVKQEPGSNLLLVNVISHDPASAKKLASAYLAGLKKVYQRLNAAPASAELERVQAALANRQRILARDQHHLLDFQRAQTIPTQVLTAGSGDNLSILVLPGSWLEQAKTSELELKRLDASEAQARARVERQSQTAGDLPADVPAAQKWRDRLVEEEYQLRVAKLTQPDTSPNIEMLQSQIELTRQQLRDEVAKYFKAVRMNVASPAYADLVDRRVAAEAQLSAIRKLAEAAPAQAAKYQTLLSQVSADTAIVQKLKGQEAAAELLSTSNALPWETLDEPHVPTHPTNKSLPIPLSLAALLGAVIGACLAAFDARQRR